MEILKKILGKRWSAVLWTILILVLLCLPGSVIPKEPTFKIPQLDKIVHIILFGGFVWLWCLYYRSRQPEVSQQVKWFFYIFLLGSAYGIAMEFVQKYFIPLRDFDEGDIIADLIGAGLSYGICNIRLLKFPA